MRSALWCTSRMPERESIRSKWFWWGMGIVAVVIAAAIVAALHLNGSSSPQNQKPPSAAGTTTAPPVSSPTPTASSAPPNGTQLASYSFDLPNTYWAALGLTAPTRAQLSNQSPLDIQYNGELYFGTNDQILALPNNSALTYQACANNTQIENGGTGLGAFRGTAFCVVERGTIAGVEVSAVNYSPAYVVLNVTIWQNT
jgi:hypothetical protein